MSLSLNQMREGARLIAARTAKQDLLTAEISVTLGQCRQAVDRACQQITGNVVGQQERLVPVKLRHTLGR